MTKTHPTSIAALKVLREKSNNGGVPFPFRGSISSKVKSEAVPSFFSVMIFSLSSATDNWSPLKLSFSYSRELLKRNRTQDMVERSRTHVRAVLLLVSSKIHTLWGFSDSVDSGSSQ